MSKRRLLVLCSTLIAMAAMLGALPAVGAGLSNAVATLETSSSGVTFQPVVSHAGGALTVTGPNGYYKRVTFAAGAAPSLGLFDRGGALLPDGVYTYELLLTPVVDADTRAALAAARKSGDDSVIEALRADGKLPAEPQVQSGTFALSGGALVDPSAREAAPAQKKNLHAATSSLASVTLNDQVIPDDLIVQGSACVGLDCVNNESFGFDTIRLKENNTRIKFEDTSVGSFPSTDWQLTANDSASGGANKFSIEDITAARVPFTITGSAPTNSIFVDSSGRVGLRTATPVLDLHISTTNTPAIRLEQTSGGGFTAQTWDIAGNEANFFIRDVTGGSRLPFRIRPGAPTSSVDINASGNVGFGTASPAQAIHVSRSGTVRTQFEDTSSGVGWNQVFSSTNYRVKTIASGTDQFILDTAGNLTVTGTVMGSSDVNAKENITPVDAQAVLAKVADLPIARWNYRTESPAVTHLGPMAQDFHAAFGLGANDRTLAMVDTDGVALAAIKALYQQLQQKETELQQIKRQNDDLAARLSALEARSQAAPGSN